MITKESTNFTSLENYTYIRTVYKTEQKFPVRKPFVIIYRIAGALVVKHLR